MDDSGYRTPEEREIQNEHERQIRRVLQQAVQDGASLQVAMEMEEPAEVVEMWTNRLWDGLRDNLSPDLKEVGTLMMDDRTAAIVLLLTKSINETADNLLASMRMIGDK